jgi:DNA-binding MarR family transcriptional regulator
MNQFGLSEEDFEIWLTWKYTFKTIFGRILKDAYASAGVSDGDFMVLDLLTRSESGKLRQQELVNQMEWTKSRLSHHLTRMGKRDLVVRESLNKEKGVSVAITKNGLLALNAARPVISEGIKKYFIEQLTEQDRESIARIGALAKCFSDYCEPA